MDVSKDGSKDLEMTTATATESTSESELLTEVAGLTGLPLEWMESELTEIVKKSGHAPKELTLDELRASMLEYLEEMNREMTAQEESDLEFLGSIAVPSDISH